MRYKVNFDYKNDLGNTETLHKLFKNYSDAVRYADFASKVDCYSEIEIEDLENNTVEFLLY